MTFFKQLFESCTGWHASQSQEDQREFERVVAAISMRFSSKAGENVSDAIRFALGRAIIFLHTERGFYYTYNDAKKCFTRRVEWITGQGGNLPELLRLNNGVAVRQEDPANVSIVMATRSTELNGFFQALDPIFSSTEPRRIIAAEITRGGKLLGIVGFDGPGTDFSKQEINYGSFLLHILGEFFSYAMLNLQAVQSLQARESELRLILDSIHTACVIFSPEEHIVHSVNDTFLRLAGLKKSDILQQPCRPFFEAGFLDTLIEVDRKAAVLEMQETQLFTKDGAIPVLAAGTIFSNAGKTQVLVSFIDLSERKRVEAEQLELERRVYQSQKLDSLGVMAGGVAHDFNNLLTSILGNTELTLMDTESGSQAAEQLRDVIHSARQAASLAKQMLAYSGRGKFVVQRINMGDLIQEMMPMLRTTAGGTDVIHYESSPTACCIHGDDSQMKQVVMNLVINAVEACREFRDTPDVQIQISQKHCSESELSGLVLDSILRDGNYVCLRVEDNGCGINQETLTRIFDPFFSTKFTGRGLGLASVLGIVRGHKGGLRVTSSTGQGTLFELFFPIDSGLMKTTVEKKFDPDKMILPPKGSGLLIIADDKPRVLSVAGRMLKRMGYDVLKAENGKQAVDLFRENQEDVCCVLLDLSMPVMSGASAFNAIRKMNEAMPVIISSGYSESELNDRFEGNDNLFLLQKPYRADKLGQLLQDILT